MNPPVCNANADSYGEKDVGDKTGVGSSSHDAASVGASGEDFHPAFQVNNVPVFFSCDDRFFQYTMTSIASLMDTKGHGNNYDIFVLHEGLGQTRIALAQEWMKQYANGSLRFIDVGQCLNLSDRNGFYVTKPYPLPVYFRFFAPALFRNYDRIVYLDSDVIVLADIADLYNQDLGDHLLAAVHDHIFEEDLMGSSSSNDGVPKCGGNIGFRPGDSYFNSGVILFNLKKMREENIQDKLIEAVGIIEAPSLPDQDILNFVCKGRISFIDIAWNYQEWMAETEETSVKLHFASPAIREMCLSNKKNCKILHYAEQKPWNFNYVGTNGGYYWHYAKKTPFYPQIEAGFQRQCSIAVKIARFAHLSFHLARCGASFLFASSSRKKRFRRRILGYTIQMKALFSPSRRFSMSLGKALP